MPVLKKKAMWAALLCVTVVAWGACIELALRVYPDMMPWALRSTYLRERVSEGWKGRVFDRFEDIWINDRDLGMRRPARKVIEAGEEFHGDASLSGDTDPRKEPCQVRRIAYDADGFRNPDGQTRADIVALGDSFTEGLYIGRPWPARLGELTGRPVYNLGLARFTTVQERLSYIKFGASKHPRIVVLVFYEGNDVQEARDYALYKASGLTMTDFIVRRNKRGDEKKGCALDRLLLTRLAKYYATRALGRASAPATPSPGMTGWFPFMSAAGRFEMSFLKGYVNMLVKDFKDVGRDKGLKMDKDELRSLAGECAREGVRFIVVYVPTKEHVYLPLVEREMGREAFNREMARFLHDKPGMEYAAILSEYSGALEREVVGFCLGSGINCLDLTPVLAEEAERRAPLYFLQDSHWDQDGADLAAGTIAGYIRREGLL